MLKNKYEQILENADSIRVMLETEWNNEPNNFIEGQLENIYQIRNVAFAELLKNKVAFKRFKDFELGNSENTFLIITINNKMYKCRDSVIRNILKEDYGSILSRSKNLPTDKKERLYEQKTEEETVGEKQKSPKPKIEDTFSKPNNAQREVADRPNNNNGKSQRKEAISQNKEIPTGHKTASPIDKKKESSNFNIRNQENPEKKEHAVEQPTAEAPKKEPNQLIVSTPKNNLNFNLHDMAVKREEDGVIEYVNITVAPLFNANEEVVAHDVLVCMETAEDRKSFVTPINGKKSIVESIGDYSFIIRGSWKNDGFHSKVYPNGETAKIQENITEEKNVFAGNGEIKQHGHNVHFINKGSYEELKIHVIPLDLTNNNSGMVNILVCVETKENRETFVSNDSFLAYKNDKLHLQIFGYWEKENFTSKVKIL